MNWDALKQAERAESEAPPLDHVPKAMPALAQAQSLQSRASKAGGGVPPASGEALARVVRELASADEPATAEGLGELLFGIVELARARDLDAEEALRMELRRFRARAG